MGFLKRQFSSKSIQPPVAVPPATTPAAALPDALIAVRAYEIWRRRGCPMGQDGAHDWHAARQELEEERARGFAPQQHDRNRGSA